MKFLINLGIVALSVFWLGTVQAHSNVVVVPLGDDISGPTQEVEANGTQATASPLFTVVYSNKIYAEITFTDDDFYKIFVPEGKSLRVTTDGGREDDCGFFGADTEIEVLDTDGATRIAFNDDITPLILCSNVVTAPLSEGLYFVRVSASKQYCLLCTFTYGLTFELFDV